MMEANNECLTKYNFTTEDFYNFSKRLVLPLSNPNYPFYLDCLYKRLGWIVDGKFNYGEIKVTVSNGLGDEAADNIVDACKDLPPKENEPQTILAFGKCVVEGIRANKTYYDLWLNGN